MASGPYASDTGPSSPPGPGARPRAQGTHPGAPSTAPTPGDALPLGSPLGLGAWPAAPAPDLETWP